MEIGFFEVSIIMLFGMFGGIYLCNSTVQYLSSGNSKVIQLNPDHIDYKIGKFITELKTNNFKLFGLVYFIILLFFYLLFNTITLNLLSYFEILIFSLWFGAVISLLNKKHIKGKSWYVFSTILLLINFLFIISINLAIDPIYSTDKIDNLLKIIIENGLFGTSNYIDQIDIFWISIHITGILILFYVVRRIFLMLIQLLVSNQKYSFEYFPLPWKLEKKDEYITPLKNLFILNILTMIAGVMVSGQLINFFNHGLPYILNLIFFGSKGM